MVTSFRAHKEKLFIFIYLLCLCTLRLAITLNFIEFYIGSGLL